MIFCNYGGGGYSLMHHTIWNGLHVADLVFPYFVWIMGVCIPISLTANFKKGLSNRTIFLNILKVTNFVLVYRSFRFDCIFSKRFSEWKGARERPVCQCATVGIRESYS